MFKPNPSLLAFLMATSFMLFSPTFAEGEIDFSPHPCRLFIERMKFRAMNPIQSIRMWASNDWVLTRSDWQNLLDQPQRLIYQLSRYANRSTQEPKLNGSFLLRQNFPWVPAIEAIQAHSKKGVQEALDSLDALFLIRSVLGEGEIKTLNDLPKDSSIEAQFQNTKMNHQWRAYFEKADAVFQEIYNRVEPSLLNGRTLAIVEDLNFAVKNSDSIFLIQAVARWAHLRNRQFELSLGDSVPWEKMIEVIETLGVSDSNFTRESIEALWFMNSHLRGKNFESPPINLEQVDLGLNLWDALTPSANPLVEKMSHSLKRLVSEINKIKFVTKEDYEGIWQRRQNAINQLPLGELEMAVKAAEYLTSERIADEGFEKSSKSLGTQISRMSLDLSLWRLGTDLYNLNKLLTEGYSTPTGKYLTREYYDELRSDLKFVQDFSFRIRKAALAFKEVLIETAKENEWKGKKIEIQSYLEKVLYKSWFAGLLHAIEDGNVVALEESLRSRPKSLNEIRMYDGRLLSAVEFPAEIRKVLENYGLAPR